MDNLGFSAHPLAGGTDHDLDATVALAAQLVGIVALGPLRAETARLGTPMLVVAAGLFVVWACRVPR
jgi:hypothetical protein